MISDKLRERLQNEIKLLYQNYEQEGMKEYMPLIKELTNAVLPYMTSGKKEVQNIIKSIQNGVEAFKHTDMIGMADALVMVLTSFEVSA